jgi:hypothetical protein
LSRRKASGASKDAPSEALLKVHVDDIEAALKELSRVAKKGCIIVPHWTFEGLWNKGYHLWLISERNGRMVFRRKCRLFDMDTAEFRDRAKQLFWRLYSHHREVFEVRYEWEGQITYEIIRCGCPDFVPQHTASVDATCSKPIPLKGRIKRWGRIAVTRMLRWVWMKLGWLPKYTAPQRR